MTPELSALLAKARRHKMTPIERERQIISFAYGNVHIHDDRVTIEEIVRQSRMDKADLAAAREAIANVEIEGTISWDDLKTIDDPPPDVDKRIPTT